MDYVGLHGRCECLGMRDAEGRSALLVIVTTKLNVPVAEREQFQPYVQRKLAEWGEIDHLPVMVVIRDAQDLARAQRQHRHVSSTRIASVMAAANAVELHEALPSDLLAVARQNVRARAAVRRREREESAPVPLAEERPVTNLGELASA